MVEAKKGRLVGSLTHPVRRHDCPFVRGDHPFELNFRAQALQIAMNDGDRQFPAFPSIGYRAVSCIELPVDLSLVPIFGVPDIGEAEIVLLGPEERHGVEALPPTKDVARRGLTLALGNHPVLDADWFAGEPIRPACYIARCEDAGDARLEILVNRDAMIDSEPCLLCQRDRRSYPDPGNDEIGPEDFSRLQRNAFRVNRRGRRTEMKSHAVRLMKLTEEIPYLRSQDLLHRDFFWCDHLHIDVPRAQRCGHLQADEASAENHCVV
jgi:hypothetical protein